MLKEYEEYLQLRYGNKYQAVLGLHVAAMLDSIFRRQGIRAYAPIGVVVQSDAQADMLEEDLKIFRKTPRVALTDKNEDFCVKLRESKDDVVFVRYKSGKKAEYLLDILHSHAQSESGSRERGMGLVVICFVGFVPMSAKKFFDFCFSVSDATQEVALREGLSNSSVELKKLLVGFVLKKLSLVEWHLEKEKTTNSEWIVNGTCCRILRAAGIVFSLLLEERDRENWQTSYEEIIRAVEYQSADFHIEMDLTSVVRRALYTAVEGGMRVVHKDELMGDDIRQIAKILLFDEKFYYLSEDAFSYICKSLEVYMSLRQIKAELTASGVLHGTGGDDGRRGYYTVKIPIYSVYGNLITPRMVRLCRVEIDMPGEEELWQVAEYMRGASCIIQI